MTISRKRLTPEEVARAVRLLEKGAALPSAAAASSVTEIQPDAMTEALEALDRCAKMHGDVRAIDAARLPLPTATAFRAVFDAAIELKYSAALSRPHEIDVIPLDLALHIADGKVDSQRLRLLRKVAALQAYRLFDEPVRDAELRVCLAAHLVKRHHVTEKTLEENEAKRETSLREEHAQKTAAALVLLRSEKPCEPRLTELLLERIGTTGDRRALPYIEPLTRSGNSEVASAARAAIGAIERGCALTVVFATMEVRPFCGTGGLGNVMHELPTALARMGHRPIVIAPKHQVITDQLAETSLGGVVYGPEGPATFRLYKTELEGVEYWFVENDYFSRGRPGIYGNGEGDYADNAERYDFLGAVLPQAISKILGSKSPDVVQLDDAHTATGAFYLKLDPTFESTRVALAVHNLGAAYQGRFDAGEHLGRMRFDAKLFQPFGPAEFHGGINLLKMGLSLADKVIMVSRQYKKETLTPEKGEGLHGVLQWIDARGRLTGNVNGIDTTKWDPSTDPLIAQAFSFADREGKAVCKATLQKRLGLPARPATPLVGVVARLTEQKGFDAIIASIKRSVAEQRDVQFVILGDGERRYRRKLEALAKAHPEMVALAERFSSELEHQIYAGSDFSLMPSRFEPCGLTQMYALRYGSIPIVSPVGGLEETIEDYDEARGTGNGFKINDGDAHAALCRALAWYGCAPEKREALIRNAFSSDFSWEATSAAEQACIYREMLDRPGVRLRA